MKLTLFLLACLVVLPVVRGADPDPKIAAAIAQLGDPDFKKRETATQELRAIGKPALPQLEAAKSHPDPEVRERVADILRAINPPAPTATGPAAARPGHVVLQFGGGGLGGQFMVMRPQRIVQAVEVAGNQNIETVSQSAFKVDGKSYKVTRTQKNGVKHLKVEVTETKDGEEISRTVEAEDDDALAKNDAELAKIIKQHAGKADEGEILQRQMGCD